MDPEILSILGAALVAILGFLARKYAAKLHSEMAKNLIILGTEAVERAFLEIEQTFVGPAKERNKDSKLTQNEIAAAGRMAASRALSYIPNKTQKKLANVLGNEQSLKNFINSNLEANVARKKLEVGAEVVDGVAKAGARFVWSF